MRRNVALARQTGKFDTSYLTWLSDDAIPEIARTLPRLPAPLQASAVAEICARPARATKGWAAWSTGRGAADDARRRMCGAG